MHLFDRTVKPVLLYGSEICATTNTASAKVKKDSFSLFNTMYDMPCEKLHIKLLKYLLAVNRKSKKVSNDQEPIQSDPRSCPQNQKGNN